MTTQHAVLETREVQSYKNRNLDFAETIAQLSRGEFYARSDSLLHNDISIFRRRSSQTVFESGKFPDNHTAIFFYDSENSVYVKGRYYGKGGISSLRANDNWKTVTRKDAAVYAIILRNDCLHRYFDQPQLDDFTYFVNYQHGGTSNDKNGQAPVFRIINRAFDYLQRKIVNVNDEVFLQNIRDDIMYFLGSLLSTMDYDLLRVNSKAKLVDRTLEVIHSSPLHDLKVSDIAKELHTNRRNIEIAFGQYLGISPKEYIINLKLNAIRMDLLSVPIYQKSISQIAKSHGIVHMGNFSKAYFNLFHENPSQTRKQALNLLARTTTQKDSIAALANVN